MKYIVIFIVIALILFLQTALFNQLMGGLVALPVLVFLSFVVLDKPKAIKEKNDERRS